MVDVLSAATPIVDDSFKPTKEFMIKWSQLATKLGTIPLLSTPAQVSAVFDVIGAAHNDLFVRGTTQWGVLAPGAIDALLTMTAGGPAWVTPTVGTLAGLSDVLIASPADNDVLTYVAASSKWENKPASGGGGGSGPPVAKLTSSGTLSSHTWGGNSYNVVWFNETFTPAEASSYEFHGGARKRAGGVLTAIIVADDSTQANGYFFADQNDGNQVLYRINSNALTSMGSGSGGANQGGPGLDLQRVGVSFSSYGNGIRIANSNVQAAMDNSANYVGTLMRVGIIVQNLTDATVLWQTTWN